jgi:hypothetical protein
VTREEIDALIEAFDEAIDPSIEFTEAQFSQVLALARLGASVVAPSEAEIEAMARGICQQHADAMGNTWGVTFDDYWTNNKAAFVEDARAALAILKDSANG